MEVIFAVPRVFTKLPAPGDDHVQRAFSCHASDALVAAARWACIAVAIFYGYNYRMRVSVAEAKNALPRLIKAVEDGEPVTICRHGTPVADIVRTRKARSEKPKFGTLKGKVTALDHDWWKPMTGDEADALLDGR
jgi:prevent-host-death family protein